METDQNPKAAKLPMDQKCVRAEVTSVTGCVFCIWLEDAGDLQTQEQEDGCNLLYLTHGNVVSWLCETWGVIVSISDNNAHFM